MLHANLQKFNASAQPIKEIADGRPILPLTRSLVNEWLPKDLTNIIIKYFQSTVRDWDRISLIGEYETCLRVQDISHLNLTAICSHGYMDILKFMMFWGVIDWNIGLFGACDGNQKEIADLVILRATKDRDCRAPIDWTRAIQRARKSGNEELADYLVAHPLNQSHYA